MGMVFNRTLVVSGFNYDDDDKYIKSIHKKAMEIFTAQELEHLVTGLHGGMNSSYSFMVTTSGSKEGWDMQIIHEECIRELIDFIHLQHKNGDSYADYVYITHGGDSKGIGMDPCVVEYGDYNEDDEKRYTDVVKFGSQDNK